MRMIKNGTVISGRYEIKKKIGAGGTSSVYLVYDKHIGRNLAMKVMDKKSLGAFRFARSEIESLRRVRYPLFPEIHDAFADGKNIYIVSEYVNGRPLWDIIKGVGMDRERALTIARFICEALIYLHRLDKPILYLDLKPDNIIIDDNGLPHLIDFGIAVWLASNHVPVGTIGYSPPEQYVKDGTIDERADIYAFGMTYYAIRAGIPPDPDPEKTISAVRHSHIFSRAEKTFLAKCTASLIEERYTDATQVLKQIKHIRSNPYRIRKKLMTFAVAAGVVLLGAFAGGKGIKHLKEKNAAQQLLKNASENMQQGVYTPEGIGLIKACINSGTLSKECEQEFVFEVAMNLMLVSRDYRGAATYFSKLDQDKYPEASDYLRLCRMQTGFDHDPQEAIELTSRLFSDIAVRAPSAMKYENLIFIAGCFENYDEDKDRGLEKALTVLNFAADELDDPGMTPMPQISEDEIKRMRARIDELKAVKEKQIKIRKENKMIGDTYDEKNKKP